MISFCSDFPQQRKLREIVENKNYTEFFEDDKEILWKLRYEVRDLHPENLAKLLLITKWNRHEDVAQVEYLPGIAFQFESSPSDLVQQEATTTNAIVFAAIVCLIETTQTHTYRILHAQR